MRDGSKITYVLRTPASVPAGTPRLVLVHSLALDQKVWDAVVERLERNVSIVTYDCRGHGSSDRTAGPYSVELFADDLDAVMSAIGWPSAVVAGASMGGCVALAFGASHPERTLALALIDTTAWYGLDADRRWEQRAAEARASGLTALVDFQLARWFTDDFRTRHPDVAEGVARVFVANDIECYVASCKMLGSLDLRSRAISIRLATVVIVGDDDYATPLSMARELHSSIPGSSLVVLPGARHLTPLERPDEIARALSSLFG